MQLCDTNILSELIRRQPNPGVLAWADGMRTLAISAVTLDELVYGLAGRPVPRIVAWLDRFLADHCEIVPITAEVARVSGQLRGLFRASGDNRSQADMMIAATAKVHGYTLVTRNVRDFEGCGIVVLNPFRE